jgi:prolyl oligopeptidase
MKKKPWEDWDIYHKLSPLRYVNNIRTPVLLQHCEGDIRVPISQGIMFYRALKENGVPVRFMVLPRQTHGPTEPRMLQRVMEANLAWMDQHILGKEKGF